MKTASPSECGGRDALYAARPFSDLSFSTIFVYAVMISAVSQCSDSESARPCPACCSRASCTPRITNSKCAMS